MKFHRVLALSLATLLLAPWAGAQALVAPPPAPAAAATPDALGKSVFPPPALDYQALDRLIIQHGGRKKPFLTFALEMTREITGRASFRTDAGVRIEARAFVASLLLGQPQWMRQPIIFIDYAPLKQALGLETTTKRFSFEALSMNPSLPALMQEVQMVKARDGANAKLDSLQKQVEMLVVRMEAFQSLVNGSAFTLVPDPKNQNGRWVTIPEVDAFYTREQLTTFNRALLDLVLAYVGSEKADRSFTDSANALVAAQRALAPEMVPTGGRVSTELVYDTLHPFRYAWILYMLAAIAFATTWKAGRTVGTWLGWGLTIAGLAFHLSAFAARIYISGRAPVTNMYETVVWVALGLLAFAIWFECKYRSRVFILSALPLAVVFMIAADSLPVVLSPSLNPLVAVLRDNFWLTTHVLTVTTSYAAFALAMAVGHVAIFKQILNPGPQGVHPDILAYIYRTMQVGIILIVFGIILGGVWANYSWGRFWGWDPKETWALIAALVYLAILHGRIAGWWSPFGFAVGAVLGFQGVIMAWYGVNFIIGAGLHSYGFGTGGQGWVAAFCILEVVLVTAAIIRRRQLPRVAG